MLELQSLQISTLEARVFANASSSRKLRLCNRRGRTHLTRGALRPAQGAPKGAAGRHGSRWQGPKQKRREIKEEQESDSANAEQFKSQITALNKYAEA
jgi:hypothetical protein